MFYRVVLELGRVIKYNSNFFFLRIIKYIKIWENMDK